MRKKPRKTYLKPNDREVVAQAQFRTSAGPIPDKSRDPKRRRMSDRLEEQRVRQDGEE